MVNVLILKSSWRDTNWKLNRHFHKHTKTGNNGINAYFVSPDICSFLLYLQDMMLVSVQ